MLPWVSIAPFGVPVVPPVYCSTARSSGSIAHPRQLGRRRPAPAGRPASACRRRAAAPPPAAEYSASDVTMICSIAGLRAATAVHQRRQRVERDHDAHAGVGGDGQHLARGVARVDVDDDRAEAQHGERRDDVLRAVRQHDADAIALDDAEPRQRCGERVGALLQIEEGQLRAEKLRRRPIGPLDRGEC